MPNENCLEGMACPKCQSEGPFHIQVTAMARVSDDGIEETNNPEWDDASFCMCHDCEHTGDVSDFTAKAGDA